jgi:hypothetical protein
MVIANDRTHFHRMTATVYEAFLLSEVGHGRWHHPETRMFSCRGYLAPTGWPPEACGLTVLTEQHRRLVLHALEHLRPRYALHMAASAGYEEVSPRRSISPSTPGGIGRHPHSLACSMCHWTRSSRDALLPRTFSACQLRFNGCFVSCAPPASRHSAAEHPKKPECSRTQLLGRF